MNSQIRDDTALGRLMHDFLCKNPKDMHYDVLSDTAKLAKEREDEKGMCKIIDDIIERECKDVEQKAKKEASFDTARRMINEGVFTNEQIAKISNLPLGEVEKLIKERSA